MGAHVVVYAGTLLGRGVRLGDGCVVGKPPVLGARSSAAREAPGPARLGDGVAIGAGAVVLAGAVLGEGCVVGDQAHVRERVAIGGADGRRARRLAVENDVRIGARVRLQTNAYITAWSVVEDDVFVAPGRDR